MAIPPPFFDRRWLIPEVVQASTMDCGMSALKALLEGFRIRVNYARLRDACHTTLDGTSLDTLEEVANQLGLDAQQILVPADHFALPEARTLPALLLGVTPTGYLHVLVVWRRHGAFLQVMDPARGRRWVRWERLRDSIYRHEMPVPAAAWRAWAATDELLGPLRRRLAALGVAPAARARLVDGAKADTTWRGLAALDASTRMTQALIDARVLARGEAATRLVESSIVDLDIPQAYWSVVAPAADAALGDDAKDQEQEDEEVRVRGIVLIRARGRRDAASAAAEPPPGELRAVLDEPPARPERELWRIARNAGLAAPFALAASALVEGATSAIEALPLVLLLGAGPDRAAATIVLVLLLPVLGLAMRAGTLSLRGRVARQLEGRVRVAILDKLPRLRDQYFATRPGLGLAARASGLHAVRALPAVLVSLLSDGAAVLVAAAAIVWVFPAAAGLVALGLVLGGLAYAAGRAVYAETELLQASLAASAGKSYLNALAGPVPIRAQGAERALLLGQEDALVVWARAARRHERVRAAFRLLCDALSLALALALAFRFVASSGPRLGLLVVVYLAFVLARRLASFLDRAAELPRLRVLITFLLEPIAELEGESAKPAAAEPRSPGKPAELRLEGVRLSVGGLTILDGIDLTIAAGSRVAIVGRSGAGKTSLVGLLLGWLAPSEGRVLIDGRPLTPELLEQVRRGTVWVDPAVQLWNRSLAENVGYGIPPTAARPTGDALAGALLSGTAAELGRGTGVPLGENGSRLSGGEGQRVRFARGMAKRKVGLVVLDEAFRGLDEVARTELLTHARELWAGATFVCVSHDMAIAASFERVIVLENGRIVEDGDPRALLAREGSAFHARTVAEEAARGRLFGNGTTWRAVSVRDGIVAVS